MRKGNAEYTDKEDRVFLEFTIPSRGIIGLEMKCLRQRLVKQL